MPPPAAVLGSLQWADGWTTMVVTVDAFLRGRVWIWVRVRGRACAEVGVVARTCACVDVERSKPFDCAMEP
jgi:hypothetical protein